MKLLQGLSIVPLLAQGLMGSIGPNWRRLASLQIGHDLLKVVLAPCGIGGPWCLARLAKLTLEILKL